MQATWRRIIIGSLGTFAVVLGFLAGRMNGGGDPGLDGSATAHAKVVKSRSAGSTSAGSTSGDTSQPDSTTSSDPYGEGSSDGGYGTSTGGSASSPDLSPPVTASS
jgi:hypothetical protein